MHNAHLNLVTILQITIVVWFISTCTRKNFSAFYSVKLYFQLVFPHLYYNSSSWAYLVCTAEEVLSMQALAISLKA